MDGRLTSGLYVSPVVCSTEHDKISLIFELCKSEWYCQLEFVNCIWGIFFQKEKWGKI